MQKKFVDFMRITAVNRKKFFRGNKRKNIYFENNFVKTKRQKACER